MLGEHGHADGARVKIHTRFSGLQEGSYKQIGQSQNNEALRCRFGIGKKSDDWETKAATWAELVGYGTPIYDTVMKQGPEVRPDVHVWDPFFCSGVAKQRLEKVGFPRVIHEPVDFFSYSKPPAENCVIVSNPPFSLTKEICTKLSEPAFANVPFALIVPVFKLFCSEYRALYQGREETMGLVFPASRIQFDLPQSSSKMAARSSFDCCLITRHLGSGLHYAKKPTTKLATVGTKRSRVFADDDDDDDAEDDANETEDAAN